MHEFEIVKNILNTAIEYGKQAEATQIQQIEIQLGKATNILPESLQLAFDFFKQGTIAENACLEINYMPIISFCLTCYLEFQSLDHLNECPVCRRVSNTLRQGNELYIKSLKIL